MFFENNIICVVFCLNFAWQGARGYVLTRRESPPGLCSFRAHASCLAVLLSLSRSLARARAERMPADSGRAPGKLRCVCVCVCVCVCLCVYTTASRNHIAFAGQ